MTPLSEKTMVVLAVVEGTGEHRTVVIVEDEAIIRLTLRNAISDLGWKVVGETAYGEEAADLVARSQPDFVFMDIKLKGEMDGVDAAREIESRCPDVALVFLSAFDRSAEMNNWGLQCARAYLTKPVTADQIRHAFEFTAPH